MIRKFRAGKSDPPKACKVGMHAPEMPGGLVFLGVANGHQCTVRLYRYFAN